MHIRQSIASHLRDDPVEGMLQARRATQAISEPIRHLGQPVVRVAVSLRRRDDTVGCRPVRRDHGTLSGNGGGEEETRCDTQKAEHRTSREMITHGE